jgi:hypothetical protein
VEGGAEGQAGRGSSAAAALNGMVQADLQEDGPLAAEEEHARWVALLPAPLSRSAGIGQGTGATGCACKPRTNCSMAFTLCGEWVAGL